MVDAEPVKSAFISQLSLMNDRPFASEKVHCVEAFGPVSTIIPYKNMEDAIALSKKGKGSLCSTIITADHTVAKRSVISAATHYGRNLS